MFFPWYGSLPPIIRFGAAILCLLVSTVFLLGGTFWPWGWAAGAVLLVFSFPSDSEKKGYDW